jgi:hypothetical protein
MVGVLGGGLISFHVMIVTNVSVELNTFFSTQSVIKKHITESRG